MNPFASETVESTPCGCRMSGNQHGRYFRACPRHEAILEREAAKRGLTPEATLNQVLREHLTKEEKWKS